MNLKENQKTIAMIALLCLLGGVMYYNFSSGGDESDTTTPSKKPKTTSASKGTTAPTPKPGELPVITSPLVLASMSNKSQEPAVGRNIFLYPPPTPPPPIPTPPPPIPPPIQLSGVNPGGVIAQTGEFTLTVIGAKIPSDAKAFIGGREQKTTFVSETQIKVVVPAAVIAGPGSLPVEVRGASDPAKMFSNVVNLNVTPPPNPPYKYLGMYVKNGLTTAMLKFDLEEGLLTVRKDTVLGGHWKVLNITDQDIEFEDTNIKVRHRVPFTGEGAQ